MLCKCLRRDKAEHAGDCSIVVSFMKTIFHVLLKIAVLLQLTPLVTSE